MSGYFFVNKKTRRCYNEIGAPNYGISVNIIDRS